MSPSSAAPEPRIVATTNDASLTGDPLTDALVGPALRLAWAVRTADTREIDLAITEAGAAARSAGAADCDDPMHALVIVLAAMIPPDWTPGQLLGWLSDPETFLRMLGEGCNSGAASASLLARTPA